MSPRILALSFALFAVPAFAQDADVAPAGPVAPPIVDTERNGVLRGIGRVSLEINLSEGARPEDADLRADLRDAIELELRRAGIQLNDSVNASGSPVLRFTVKFDRGAGRYAARLVMAVRDQVTVTRNRETLTAEIWTVERGASSALDTGLSREVRTRARDMAADFVTALRKGNR